MKVAGIYLAAGQSRRMGTSKVSLPLSPNVALGAAALRELDRCGLEPLVVVVRADDRLDWLPDPPERRRWTETCLTAHLGLSFSLRCGLNAVLPTEPDAVLVALADQPFITAGLVRRLIETLGCRPDLDYVAGAREGGGGMPPALFSRKMFPALQELDGDAGAAALMRSPGFKGAVLEGDSPFWRMDADTDGDYRDVARHWQESGI
ncbi:NTP transferase domain-containing protein [Paenibacillus glufosinatiresistens]|uniref:NTP transferase domain-containing protein n=1 Tax=Paenibacillus glufosinatiresistens TaxID=3070657 RepID=UPI00286E1238|nr:NTP transferase domain-containing protein [Paenibacillus sp. YX.27]